jgi:heme-degrading monooxygenase HmoA
VIARLWSAQTTREHAPAYAEHLQRRVLPQLKSLAGYAGAMLLEREVPDGVEITVLTVWQSLDAIHGFAGDNIEQAVVEDEAAAILNQFDAHVRHFDVVVKDGEV